jgi:hypothetical protein
MSLSNYLHYLDFSPLCVWSTMQFMPEKQIKGLIYARCETTKSQLSRMRSSSCGERDENCTLPRPCLSKKYVMAMYDALVDSAACLGVTARELFTIFRAESNLMLNAGSASFRRGVPTYHSDWGIAQLTPQAISALNGSSLLKELKERPACAKFQGLLKSDLPSELPCSRMALPDNPARSFLYGGALYVVGKQLMKRAVEREVSRGRLTMEATAKESLIRHLARYTYNAGGGIDTALARFLDQRGANALLQPEFRQEFSRYLGEHFGDDHPNAYTPELYAIKRRIVAGYALGLESWIPSTFYGHTNGVQCVDH